MARSLHSKIYGVGYAINIKEAVSLKQPLLCYYFMLNYNFSPKHKSPASPNPGTIYL